MKELDEDERVKQGGVLCSELKVVYAGYLVQNGIQTVQIMVEVIMNSTNLFKNNQTV